MAIPRYLIFNAIIGPAIGVLFALALLASDSFGLRSLVLGSRDVIATTVIYVLGSAMTFTPFVVATAVALLARATDALDR